MKYKHMVNSEQQNLTDFASETKRKIVIEPKPEVEEIHVIGWKGKDNIEIRYVESELKYIVIEHRKEKETGDIYEQKHEVMEKDVKSLLRIIERLHDTKPTSYRELVNDILLFNNITDADIESFNGGKNRAKYYFKLLYYPLKVLEGKGLIQYFGRGGVMLVDGKK